MLDVLLVDDEPSLLAAMHDVLTLDGHTVLCAGDGAKAVELLLTRSVDAVICDMRLPVLDGVGVFRHVREHAPNTDFVFITAFGAVPEAVQALKEGATDYLTKPFRLEELRARVAQIDRARALRRELALARSTLAREGKSRAVGQSPAFRQALLRLPHFAESHYPVLIVGESGTGKELVTHMLHEQSQRRRKPLVTVNCAALPESLLEAELFGYRRGAFTGAVGEREGRFRTADGGTLFLDEVAEMPPGAQAKLLRVLQEGVFEPLGSDRSYKVDVRIVSATHRDLRAWVARGLFREDLYYRLKVLTIEVPPLRARTGDVVLLVEHFLTELHHPGGASNVAPAAMAQLAAYPFPGNVRELMHALQYACVLARGRTIEVGHLPSELTEGPASVAPAKSAVGPVGPGGPSWRPAGAKAPLASELPTAPPAQAEAGERPAAWQDRAAAGERPAGPGALAPPPLGPLSAAQAAFERAYLARALAATGGRRAEAAALLAISRKGLWEKLKRHGLA